jgi:hypothetical protein
MPKTWDKTKGSKRVSRVPKKKPLTIAEIDAKVAKLQEEWSAVLADIAPLQEKASRLHNKAAALQNQKDKMILASKKRVDWAWLLDVYPESTAKHEFRREQFRKLGLMDPFGHWRDTGQTTVKIGLNKHESTSDHYKNATQLKAVKKLLPFIKPVQGAKRVEIFEHTLSANGNYWLEFYEDGRILLARTYGQPTSFKTIEEAFEYVRLNLWYQSSDPDDNRRSFDDEFDDEQE